MLTIGCHLSTSKGFLHMAKEAVSINANTFQFFTRNPRGGAARSLNKKDIQAYIDYAAQYQIQTVLGYAPYTLNPASSDIHKRDFAKLIILEDIARLREVPSAMYLVRPGSDDVSDINVALNNVSEVLKEVVSFNEPIKILLDTMSGEGHQVGYCFEQLAQIIFEIKHNEMLGICLDCSAIWSAGYNIKENLDDVLSEIDKTLGISRIFAIHLNDSKEECGSRVNRHAKIGEGEIGFDALARVVNHPKLKNIPLYLEEHDSSLVEYERDIKKFRSVYID